MRNVSRDLEATGFSDPLDGARVCLDVDHVSDGNLLLLDGLVDAWVELELLGALRRLQTNYNVRHCDIDQQITIF